MVCVILTNNEIYGLIDVITGGNIMKKDEFYQYLYNKMKIKGINLTSEYEIEIKKFVDQLYDSSLEVAGSLDRRQTDIFRRRYGILVIDECQTLATIAEAYGTCSENIRKLLLKSEAQIMQYIKVQTTLKNINLDTLISDLNISTRTLNCLRLANIMTIKDVLSYSKSKLLKIRGLGINGVIELETFIRMLGYDLASDNINDVENSSLNIPIKRLNLNTRLENILFRKRIFTIDTLITYSRNDLLRISGMGVKGVDEIEIALASLGYKLKSIEENNILDNSDTEYSKEKITLEQLKRIRSFITEQQEIIDEYSTNSSDVNIKYKKY